MHAWIDSFAIVFKIVGLIMILIVAPIALVMSVPAILCLPLKKYREECKRHLAPWWAERTRLGRIGVILFLSGLPLALTTTPSMIVAYHRGIAEEHAITLVHSSLPLVITALMLAGAMILSIDRRILRREHQ